MYLISAQMGTILLQTTCKPNHSARSHSGSQYIFELIAFWLQENIQIIGLQDRAVWLKCV